MIIITDWYGRLGNNILQILNAIQYGLINNHSVISFKYLSILSDIKINIKSDIDNNIKFSNIFFDIEKLGIDRPTAKQYRELYFKYVKHLLNLKDIQCYDSTYVGIHIRSGDIFDIKPHMSYVQPPYVYYTEIINKYNNKILVYEDTKNPCVNKLINSYNFNIIQSSTIENDLNLLLHCENIIIGFGSFGLLIYIMSEHLKNLYIPKYYYEQKNFDPHVNPSDWGNDINIIPIDLPNYLKPGEWQNTKEQQATMLNYSFQ